MKMKKTIIPLVLALGLTSAYTTSPNRAIARKAFIETCAAAAFLEATTPSHAFDGSGSSAYAGKSTTSKAELKKSYEGRVIADMKDFKRLGSAIKNGETDGDVWVNFFIEYQRREPDDVGRAYAAFVDLVGNKERSGCGTLLAATFSKPGKPSEGLPSVKKYNAMAKLLEPMKAAGQKGDATKAKTAYGKASDAVEAYLEAVGLPSLSDPIYD
mmetsp:Transcript_18624/g.39984  ORF Transcript_18624/g.39984 Transcript_18624/m.39984 type:complete len:213 (-) Transcript_18624:476-1114(-)|eukprot:CAMPEP_0172526156 /NCGR_PEP_ID=MMETSP1067-20121228/1130_1 /TAXON_ID=265564 ORGANISM="Thalassiosira punctigera, Strain Tpunct2005C2" /NCGR_SAMPLE_ID=MMETSP1067 /ASSEMBLY_ACC=CAM_ASM_000444 /LENGTH=212 /DNA_ID=CAMNT_0013309601 /DNA_START=25 /DNA_END=663 /DNA_ORIENTATION=+